MDKAKVDISVVIPIYRNESFIDELCSRLKSTLSSITDHFEVILVNDGSPDGSWEKIKKNANPDSRVSGICFSRNFGQHIAITAGLDFSSGNRVVIMDGDLQDKPEEIIKLYNKAGEGHDVVVARRKERKDRFFKKMFSKLFYRVFDFFVGGKTESTAANFGIYSRKVIDNFNKMREQKRFFPLFIHWLGFEAVYVDVEHGERVTGGSAYTFSKRINLALDTILSLTNKPLKFTIKLGMILSIISFFFGAIMILKYIIWGVPIQGWTSLIVSVYFLGGLLLFISGILGLYIGKIFDEVKRRPLYIIDKVINIEHE
ncbi:MAG: glycosyltransferase family 2 protein [Candidatus Aminicenantes bacterium]|nr:glycosyltransferase family 2 protein [Candidatus Aminicenantes bacterium]